jgi:predicted carbohydrate-binding protein with CBM5 and CBM33 domain
MIWLVSFDLVVQHRGCLPEPTQHAFRLVEAPSYNEAYEAVVAYWNSRNSGGTFYDATDITVHDTIGRDG